MLTAELWGLNFAVTATFGINLCSLFCISVPKTAGDVSLQMLSVLRNSVVGSTRGLAVLGVFLALSDISLSIFPAPELLCPWEQLDGDAGMLLQCFVLPSNGAQHCHHSCQE